MADRVAYRRDYYLRNRERQKERVREWTAKNNANVKRLFAEFRKNGCCVCGETHPACLQAHHKDPNTKEFRIWEMRHNNHTPAKVQAELAKCVCICGNCHRKLHYGISDEERAPQINYKRQPRLVRLAKSRLLNTDIPQPFSSD